MPKYVLVGGPFDIYDTPFSGDSHAQQCVLGNVFELPAEQAADAIAHGAALLPQSAFDALKFTVEEIAQYPNARRQQNAPPEFQSKLLAARLALHAYRAGLVKDSAPIPEAVPKASYRDETGGKT